MHIAISPCPNDTFLFYAWLKGLVAPSIIPQVTFGDIQQLNEWALTGRFPLMKVSIGILDQLLDNYVLLPVGTALGIGCGPKIIAKKRFPLEDLQEKTLAIPGKDTTAHRLLNRLLPEPKKKIYCRYDEVFSLLNNSSADCGVIIHESRFSYERLGFCQIVDLGELWHQKFNLPIPLGGIVARKNLNNLKELTETLQASLKYAWSFPSQCNAFVLEKSQEKDEEIVNAHIGLYVNSETLLLSEQGALAIETLIEKEREKWLMYY